MSIYEIDDICEIDKQNCREIAVVDRPTYDKMKYGNFHHLIGMLLVFMLYQSAKSSEIVFFTFPGEIICGVGKTGEDVKRKRR